MQSIRTKWHKIMPLVEQGMVYFTSPPGGQAPHWDDYEHDKEAFVDFVNVWAELPHFCIDRELIDLATDDDFRNSLWDMKRAGVLRLPFPAVVVEFPGKGGREEGSIQHHVVMLRDLKHPERFFWEGEDVIAESHRQACDFYGIAMGINQDEDGEYLHVSPSIVYIGIEYHNGEVMCKVISHGSGVANWDPKIESLIEKTYVKDLGSVFFAASSIYLLMATQGIDKEIIDTERINKKRGGPGKPYIPRHTYIHIGRVYKSATSEKSEEYVSRRSPRPHWRRGHVRGVRYGVKREFTKSVFIHPRLVAYSGDAKLPKPDYVVTD